MSKVLAINGSTKAVTSKPGDVFTWPIITREAAVSVSGRLCRPTLRVGVFRHFFNNPAVPGHREKSSAFTKQCCQTPGSETGLMGETTKQGRVILAHMDYDGLRERADDLLVRRRWHKMPRVKG